MNISYFPTRNEVFRRCCRRKQYRETFLHGDTVVEPISHIGIPNRLLRLNKSVKILNLNFQLNSDNNFGIEKYLKPTAEQNSFCVNFFFSSFSFLSYFMLKTSHRETFSYSTKVFNVVST